MFTLRLCVYSIVVFRCLQIGDFGSVGVGDYHFSNSCRRAKEKKQSQIKTPSTLHPLSLLVLHYEY